MAENFDAARGLAAPEIDVDVPKRRVLVTGAAGNIGSYFAKHSNGRYDLRLMVHEKKNAAETAIKDLGEVVEADLGNLEKLKKVCAGIDVVVHLAAVPSADAAWDELLEANIIGTYNIFAAAVAAGCRRVIYASSIHAMSGYLRDVQVKATDPVFPGDMYGVTKCFGEALARYVSGQETAPDADTGRGRRPMSAIVLRIGAFQPPSSVEGDKGVGLMDAWVSQRDLNQLIERSIDAPDSLRFAIFQAVSNNRFKRMDISAARELVGWEPQDDVADYSEELRELGVTAGEETRIKGHNLKDDKSASGMRKDVYFAT